MAKRGSNRMTPNVIPRSQASITLREESNGKKQTNVNAKSMLKLEHLKNLAVWTSGEASISSLAAFFGHRLAACAEALNTTPDPSLFPCQRCETILQPGYNCTVRIETNRTKGQGRRKKHIRSMENNVVYKCHFCSHRNLRRGTRRGQMKEICPKKIKIPLKSEPANSTFQKPARSENGETSSIEVNKMDDNALPEIATDDPVTNSRATPSMRMGTTLLETKKRKRNRSRFKKAAESEISSTTTDTQNAVNPKKAKAPLNSEHANSIFQKPPSSVNDTTSSIEINKMDENALPEIVTDDPVINSPATPSMRTGTTLLETNRRKRNRSRSKKAAEFEISSATTDAETAVSASSKRRRKSWTSLKEIAEGTARDNSQNFTNLTIPFLI